MLTSIDQFGRVLAQHGIELVAGVCFIAAVVAALSKRPLAVVLTLALGSLALLTFTPVLLNLSIQSAAAMILSAAALVVAWIANESRSSVRQVQLLHSDVVHLHVQVSGFLDALDRRSRILEERTAELNKVAIQLSATIDNLLSEGEDDAS